MGNNQCKIFINNLESPAVTDENQPIFALKCQLETQADYWNLQVRCEDGSIVWQVSDISTEATYIRYDGKTLEPKTCYSVYAEVFGGGEVICKTKNTFETGFLGVQWQASWIEPEQQNALHEEKLSFFEVLTWKADKSEAHTRLRPARELKRDFLISEKPYRARFYASAHGIYQLKLNGEIIGGHWLSPETSAYDSILYYQTYDVTHLLNAGQNTLEVVLADGWWIGRIGFSGDSCQYGERLGFIFQGEIVYRDNSTNLLLSDNDFECRRSNIDYADLFVGQRTDFSARSNNWKQKCTPTDEATDNLVAQPISPIEVYQKLDPVFAVSTAGELIADFGQNFAGVADITVRAIAGTVVQLDYTETLDSEGNFYRNIIGRNKDQCDVFVCGEGETKFSPRLTYHGFRYVKISGIKKEDIVSLCALAIGTYLQPTGHFECSDENLNQLQSCIRWSMRSNMISVPTDCPQREKVGWTGDILAFVQTGCFNYHLENFLSVWLKNMRAEQFDNGSVPIAVPNYPLQERFQREMNGDSASSAWSDACVMVPWAMYQHYGNIEVLKDNEAMMTRWMTFVEKRCKERPEGFEDLPEEQKKHNDYLWNKGYHFGDWFVPSVVQQPNGVTMATALTRDVIGSSFYAITLKTMIRVMDVLLSEQPMNTTLKQRKQAYQHQLKRVKTAVRECFIGEDGIIQNDLQGLYVIVLVADIVEGTLKEKVVNRLADLIVANQNRLDTGFVTTPYLLDVLSDNGHHNLALNLLFQTKSPSWLYMIEKGAKSIWENWEAIRPDGQVTNSSYNHYALGSVGDWIYRHIGGIQRKSVGYREVKFEPDINCGLTAATCHITNDFGEISCAWKWEGEVCSISIRIPPNTMGEYAGQILSAGEYDFYEKRI